MNKTIILIRGLFRGKYHWGTFPDQLQSIFPNHDIVSVDVPGCGALTSQLSPCSIEEMVDSIRAQLPMKKDIDIVALSMGGMIGLKWAQLYPNEIKSVICINTSAASYSQFYQRISPHSFLKILLAIVSKPKKRESIIYSLVSNKALNPITINQWIKIDERHTMSRINLFRQLFAAARFKVEQPKCSLLFISSRKDKLVNYKATQAIAHNWRAALIENKQDGHDIPLDNPDWLCEQIVNWLSSNASD